MSAAVFELAKKYYPKFWDKSRLDLLLSKKKLTQAEYNKLVPPVEEGENDLSAPSGHLPSGGEASDSPVQEGVKQ